MAQLDGTLREPTPTGVVADRADCWRIAVRLIKDVGYVISEVELGDVLYLAQYLAGPID